MNPPAKFRRGRPPSSNGRSTYLLGQRLWAVFLFALALLMGLKARAGACDSLFTPIVTQSSPASALNFYDSNAAEYQRTRSHVSPELQNQRRRFEALVKESLWSDFDRASILEIGAGHGRDAKYFASRGLHVVATEPSLELAKIAQKETGRSVFPLRAQQIRGVYGRFDGVWATASLIHVPTAELEMVFRNLGAAVKVGGIIHASFLTGVGTPDVAETLLDGRYFNRVSPARLRQIVASIPGLRVIERMTSSESDDYFGAAAPTSTFGFFNLYVVREF